MRTTTFYLLGPMRGREGVSFTIPSALAPLVWFLVNVAYGLRLSRGMGSVEESPPLGPWGPRS